MQRDVPLNLRNADKNKPERKTSHELDLPQVSPKHFNRESKGESRDSHPEEESKDRHPEEESKGSPASQVYRRKQASVNFDRADESDGSDNSWGNAKADRNLESLDLEFKESTRKNHSFKNLPITSAPGKISLDRDESV